MNIKLVVSRMLLASSIGSVFFLYHPALEKKQSAFIVNAKGLKELEAKEDNENEEEFTEQRLQHEFQMLRNPVTGRIPADFHEMELKAASMIPARNQDYNPLISGIQGSAGSLNQNTYLSVGPNNVGGRSRALGIDRRNKNIMITGGTTGGIFRSTDGGTNWTFVSPVDDIRSVNSITQDPLNPNTWYVGTGEVFYSVSTADIAGTVGWGVFKSTDNGQTWSKLAATQDANENQFNGQFDLVHRIAVHPTTSAVYAAVHNRIEKSSDGGATWTTVLGGTVANSSLSGICDVIIPSDGSRIFAAFSGLNADSTLVGIWTSTAGDANTWTRIAGGQRLGIDSVAGWAPHGVWGRPVLALNTANTKLFVLYKNGNSATGSSPKPEADLFSANISSNNPASYTWTNLDSFVPNEPTAISGINPYTTQFFGYDMSITPKPDNDNILFIGGTILERVDLTQTTAAKKFHRVGGYGEGFFPASENNFIYPNHHPDIHGVYFPPNTADTMLTASDGGIHKTTTSVMADTVQWQPMVTNLQTLQYQFVNIYPDVDATWIIGGAQDNGTLVNLNAPSDLSQDEIGSGDGASCAISRFTKNGATWKQAMYLTVSQGTLYRSNFTWSFNSSTNQLNYVSNTFDDITPTGLAGNGQWLTLILNDPDSTEHLYYNYKNRIYRTTTASTVTSGSWTELTGVENTVPSTANVSAWTISKNTTGTKYLYFGTDGGKIYRLNNANAVAASAATPVDITPTAMTTNSYVAGVSVNPRNADTVLVVVSNYDDGTTVQNIFWTGNATSATPTWQVLDGALEPVSSQSCAIVVKNSGVEYYVGTSVGLYSTTTINGNSTSWLQEGSGQMKRAIIRSLVNRQPDNTLVVGTHGDGAFIAQIGDAVNIGNTITAVPTIVNDKNFISNAYPTVSAGKVYYTIGNLYTVKKLVIQVIGINGQQIYYNESSYENGAIDLSNYARGNYILTIASDDGRYKFIRKLIKQ